MTIQQLYEKLHPSKTMTAHAQMLADGLSVSVSDIYTRLIKDAARCNSYSSDVFYDLQKIDRELHEFRPGSIFEPIFVGFRRHGVDGNSFILSRIGENPYNTHQEYFALYSLTVEPDGEGWYNVLFNEYYM